MRRLLFLESMDCSRFEPWSWFVEGPDDAASSRRQSWCSRLQYYYPSVNRSHLMRSSPTSTCLDTKDSDFEPEFWTDFEIFSVSNPWPYSSGRCLFQYVTSPQRYGRWAWWSCRRWWSASRSAGAFEELWWYRAFRESERLTVWFAMIIPGCVFSEPLYRRVYVSARPFCANSLHRFHSGWRHWRKCCSGPYHLRRPMKR